MLENLTTIGERLRSVQPEAMTQNDFATSLDTKLPTLKAWLRGVNAPNAKALALLAANYGVDVGWLLTGEPSSGVSDKHWVTVRRLDVEASAGNGVIVESEDYLAPIAFEEDWLRKHVGVSPKNLTVINARGDSMMPTIRSNAPILIDHSSKTIRGDAIFAIVVEGELYIKRVQKIFGGGFVLISDNPAYKPQEIRNPEEVDMIVVGEVKLVCNWF